MYLDTAVYKLSNKKKKKDIVDHDLESDDSWIIDNKDPLILPSRRG